MLAKYTSFIDKSPRGGSEIKKCHPQGCEPLIAALIDMIKDNKGIVQRAQRLDDLEITPAMFPQVISYLLTCDSEFINDRLPRDIYNKIMQEKALLEIMDVAERKPGCRALSQYPLMLALIENDDRLENVYITTDMFPQVIKYLVTGQETEFKTDPIRYIFEKTIQYNQIEDRKEFVAMYEEQGASLGDILEILKQRYHSTWRNERDFEWIAKAEPDYDFEYSQI